MQTCLLWCLIINVCKVTEKVCCILHPCLYPDVTCSFAAGGPIFGKRPVSGYSITFLLVKRKRKIIAAGRTKMLQTENVVKITHFWKKWYYFKTSQFSYSYASIYPAFHSDVFNHGAMELKLPTENSNSFWSKYRWICTSIKVKLHRVGDLRSNVTGSRHMRKRKFSACVVCAAYCWEADSRTNRQTDRPCTSSSSLWLSSHSE